MNILAFDTSSVACSVALQKEDEIHYHHEVAPMQQAKLILPIIENLLAKASLTLEDLDFIVFGRGPGSFTGIRIASSVAQGLAFAAKKPVVSLSSLAILAETVCQKHNRDKVLVSVDARMDQVYWAAYEKKQNGHVELMGEEQLSTRDQVIIPEIGEWMKAGDGWNKDESELPSARAMLELARIKFEERQWVSAPEAIPHYLR